MAEHEHAPEPDAGEMEALARVIDRLPDDVSRYGPITQDTRAISRDAARRIWDAGWRPVPQPGSPEWEAMVERAAIAGIGADPTLKPWDELGERSPTGEWWVDPEVGRNWWRGIIGAALRAALNIEEPSNG